MNMRDIKSHWTESARTNGDSLSATTRTETIKKLEIDVFRRWIEKVGKNGDQVLEIGCGNGTNCIVLSGLFPEINFWGLDYVDEMIEKGKERAKGIKNLRFDVDDVTKLESALVKEREFDIIMTDRCLINLNTLELQKKAISKIFEHLKPGGYYFMIENFVDSYANQNACREAVGLERRIPAEFNLFLEDDIIFDYLRTELSASVEAIDNFASLHDLFLYVIEPLQNEGAVKYDSLLIHEVTDFLLKIGEFGTNKFGEFGQNRLYVLRKELHA